MAELLTTNKLSELACLTLYLMYEKKNGRESVWYEFIKARGPHLHAIILYYFVMPSRAPRCRLNACLSASQPPPPAHTLKFSGAAPVRCCCTVNAARTGVRVSRAADSPRAASTSVPQPLSCGSQELDRIQARGQSGAKSPLLWDEGQVAALLQGSPIVAEVAERLHVRAR